MSSGEHEGDEELRWLDEQEKAAWTGLISLVLLLPGKLESPLRQEHGLTLFEYLVLSHLSEAPQRTLRMGERGWVVRTPDPADGRYTLAARAGDEEAGEGHRADEDDPRPVAGVLPGVRVRCPHHAPHATRGRGRRRSRQ
ncbi:hypothetical protein ACFWR9_11765 [Streptomyces sp. NPDC058534]|uniref:hypothetical protein n=1 Tax=Streptomyces sp. NPDC058534 TaxID=3346541 RepID=UPI0036598328